MHPNDEYSSVEDLNLALRLYRRLVLRVVLIAIVGIILDILLVKLGTFLSPPYGIYIWGEGLGVWGLLAILGLVVAEIWIDGRAIGRALNDPLMLSNPFIGSMSVLTVISRRAHTLGMESSGFLGPLRPAKRPS